MSCPSPLVFPTAAISTQFRGRCKKTSEPTMRKGSECFRYGISFYCSFMDIKIHIPRYQLPGTVGRRGRKSPARIIFSSSILYILASQYLSTSLLALVNLWHNIFPSSTGNYINSSRLFLCYLIHLFSLVQQVGFPPTDKSPFQIHLVLF